MSLNKAEIIGNLGEDPKIFTTESGKKIATLSVATSDTWKDKTTGEKKERTEWHRVILMSEASANFAEKYIKKGNRVYIEGKIQTRSYDKDGEKRYVTEIVVGNYSGQIQCLEKSDSKPLERRGEGSEDQIDDDIPFN